MAIVKYSTKKDVISIFEDINPGKNTIYLEGDGFNKTTLAYKHNSHMFMTPGGFRTSYVGANKYERTSNVLGTQQTGVIPRHGGSPGQTVCLGKDTAYTPQTIFGVTQTVDANRVSALTNVVPIHLLCMDPQLQRGSLSRVVSNDLQHIILIWYVDNFPSTGNNAIVWQIPAGSPVPDMHELPPAGQSSTPWASALTSQTFGLAIPTIEDGSSRFVSELVTSTMVSKTNQGPIAPTWGLRRINMLSGERSGQAQSTTAGAVIRYYDQSTGQFLGKRADGKPYYLFTSRLNDFTHTIITHSASDDSVTVNYTFATAPSPEGKSSGGQRANGPTSAMGQFCKFSSKTFTSTTNPNLTHWFSPYFDSSFNYFPLLFTWNRTSDSVSREITSITGGPTEGLSTNFGGGFPSYSGSIPGLITQTYADSSKALTSALANTAGMSCVQWNETFLSGGNRYITLFTFTGQYNYYGSSSTTGNTNGPRVMFTYQVNTATPSQLTFHSSVTIPGTPKNVVFLNDQKTIVGIITDDSIVIYQWNNADGWVLTSTIPGIFTSLGRDLNDRIWATEATLDNQYVNIHSITAGVPIRIVMRTAATNYDYEGTVIPTTLLVSAYNYNNQRIAAGITLAINGTTMTFTGGAASVLVETAVEGDVSVPLNITGAGVSDIVATINI